MSNEAMEQLRRQSQSWFESKIEELSEEARALNELRAQANRIKRNITLPLNIDDYYMLDKIAKALGMSKTAVAVNMLSDALNKAYDMIKPEGETPETFWASVLAYANKSDK